MWQMSNIADSKFYYSESSRLFHGSLMNIMGTRFDILIIGKDKIHSESVWSRIELELKRLNSLLSRFDEFSETSRINFNAAIIPVKVTDEMWDILNKCKYYHQHTFGLFDITLKDFNLINLSESNKTVSFTHPEIKIDFGGFGKGYALKKVKSILDESEIECSYVDFGNSSILGIGHHPFGEAWKVTVENPYNNLVIDELSLNDSALSISGNTPNYYGHIVSPKSKKTIIEHKMVSVISDDPLDVEVISTALMGDDGKEWNQIIENFNILNVKEYRL